MQLFVGLGNPGQAYQGQRHNIGFMAVDRLVDRHRFDGWRASKFQGAVSQGHFGSEKILMLKPDTYMNDSGRSVGAVLRFFNLDPGQVWVFHDDLDLAPGRIRVKLGGGNGGHNGLRSIDAHIGTDYHRIRLGIGHPGHKDRVTGYVLGDFAKSDIEWREALLDAVAEAAPLLLGADEAAFANRVQTLIGSANA